MSRTNRINLAFRNWTRGVSFTLALGKWQVALLVAIDYSLRKDLPFWIGSRHRLLRATSVGWKGLVDRGLVVSRPYACKHGWTWCSQCRRALSNSHAVTDAGSCVVDLLKIAGVYDELVREFLQADRENGTVQVRQRRTG